MNIRSESPADIEAIRAVNEAAFAQPAEALLVEALRNGDAELISLVAEDEQAGIVGHILFSPVQLQSADAVTHGYGLGPMAVLPAFQNQGIGSRLVREGLARLETAHAGFCVVLGHARFYPRFGFVPASQHGIYCKWDVPDDAFMIYLFKPDTIARGAAHYRPEFDTVA